MRSHAFLMTMMMLIGSLAVCTLTDPEDIYDDKLCDDVYIAPVFTLPSLGTLDAKILAEPWAPLGPYQPDG